MYFLEITNCSNSNPPFMTFFEDPDPASFVYTIERHPSAIENSSLIFTYLLNHFLIITLFRKYLLDCLQNNQANAFIV